MNEENSLIHGCSYFFFFALDCPENLFRFSHKMLRKNPNKAMANRILQHLIDCWSVPKSCLTL